MTDRTTDLEIKLATSKIQDALEGVPHDIRFCALVEYLAAGVVACADEMDVGSAGRGRALLLGGIMADLVRRVDELVEVEGGDDE